jgi:hypothetical protein
MVMRLFGVLALFFSPVAAFSGEVMFEGYYKVKLGEAHIGYIIQRYEFDQKTKSFSSINFARYKIGNELIQSSIKAKADSKLKPVSYQYSWQSGEQIKTIDATFSGNIMKSKISNGKTLTSPVSKIPPNTILSTFLPYVLLQRKLKVSKEALKYSAVAEEDGDSYWGKILFVAKQSKGEYVVFDVLQAFGKDKFRAKLALVPEGKEEDKYVRIESISSETPASKVSVDLVPTPDLATEGQTVPTKVLVELFGNVPTGKINLISVENKTKEE